MFSKQIQAAGGRGARVVRAEPEALDRVDFEDFDIRRGITAMAEVFLRYPLQIPGVREVIQPLRAKFIRYLAEGQRQGVVRQSVQLMPAVYPFTGMIFAAVLRKCRLRARLFAGNVSGYLHRPVLKRPLLTITAPRKRGTSLIRPLNPPRRHHTPVHGSSRHTRGAPSGSGVQSEWGTSVAWFR